MTFFTRTNTASRTITDNRDQKIILFISNGHGEDTAAAVIIKKLPEIRNNLSIKALPVVGKGLAYEETGAEILGPREELPSGGFMRLSWKAFFMDIKSGLVKQTILQIKALRRHSHEADLVVACGDILPVLLSFLFIRKNTVFVATAKSEYIHGHYWIEKCLIKHCCMKVFTRDPITAENLKHSGINACFHGNPVLDAIEKPEGILDFVTNSTVVGFLPGSRTEAYAHILFFLEIIEQLECKKPGTYQYAVSLSQGLSENILNESLEARGWNMNRMAEQKSGIYVLQKAGHTAYLLKGCFGDVIHSSRIIVGLSGTGNEQAAGAGKPVVTFTTQAFQCRKKFVRAQKKLLAEGLSIIGPDAGIAADEILHILQDDDKYRIMSLCGMERMGPYGGSAKIAEELSGMLS